MAVDLLSWMLRSEPGSPPPPGKAHEESESDTVSVGSRHQEAPRQRRRLVLMSSCTVATAIDSPDSHEERFQRVRRAMQKRHS